MRRSLALAAGWLAAAGVAAAAERVHVVQPGETLWQIAQRLTGDPDRWPEIYRANRDQIKDPSTLYVGQRLAIPPLADPVAHGAGSAPPARAVPAPGPASP